MTRGSALRPAWWSPEECVGRLPARGGLWHNLAALHWEGDLHDKAVAAFLTPHHPPSHSLAVIQRPQTAVGYHLQLQSPRTRATSRGRRRRRRLLGRPQGCPRSPPRFPHPPSPLASLPAPAATAVDACSPDRRRCCRCHLSDTTFWTTATRTFPVAVGPTRSSHAHP